jgi:hypothetical protein
MPIVALLKLLVACLLSAAGAVFVFNQSSLARIVALFVTIVVVVLAALYKTFSNEVKK